MAKRITAKAAPKQTHNPAADTEDFVPLQAGAKRAAPSPRVPGRGPFKLMVHPQRWRALSNGKLVPDFVTMSLRDGAGLVRVMRDADGNPVIDDARAREAREREGFVVLPFDAEGPGTSYLKKVKGAPNLFIAPWQIARSGSARMETDEARLAKFTDAIIARGIIAPPASWVLRQIIEGLEKLRDSTGSYESPKRRKNIQLVTHQLDCLRAELERAEEREAGAVAETEDEVPAEVSLG